MAYNDIARNDMQPFEKWAMSYTTLLPLLFFSFFVSFLGGNTALNGEYYYIPTDWRQSLIHFRLRNKDGKVDIYIPREDHKDTHKRRKALHVHLLHTPLNAMGAEWPLINQSSVQDNKALGVKAIYPSYVLVVYM